MNRATYRTHRATIRANGLYALRWLSGDDAATMFAIHRPASDVLALRADVARRERAHGVTNPGMLAYRLTRNVSTSDKNVSACAADCHKT